VKVLVFDDAMGTVILVIVVLVKVVKKKDWRKSVGGYGGCDSGGSDAGGVMRR
jgi:hypothetical protein